MSEELKNRFIGGFAAAGHKEAVNPVATLTDIYEWFRPFLKTDVMKVVSDDDIEAEVKCRMSYPPYFDSNSMAPPVKTTFGLGVGMAKWMRDKSVVPAITNEEEQFIKIIEWYSKKQFMEVGEDEHWSPEFDGRFTGKEMYQVFLNNP